jgi:hypothetical protein
MTSAPARIGVLTSCTGTKVSADRAVPAEDLYSGQHHVRLMRGVTEARYEGLQVNLSIVSARHGIVHGSERLVPYEQTFQGRSTENRRELARALAIPRDVRQVLGAPADLHLVLLGEDYLEACEFADDIEPSGPVLVFCAAGLALRMPPIVGVTFVGLSTDDTRRFQCGLVGLKGEVGGRLLAYIAREAPSLEDLTTNSLLENLVAVRARADVAAPSLF